MAKVAVDLSGAMETLLITLYGRALDTRRPDPILDDQMALYVVNRIDYDFRRIKINSAIAASVAARAKFLDGWTQAYLEANPAATVLHLAAGLDSRCWRVRPGPDVRWFDVDQPEVIELRRQLYPERSNYRLVASSVTADGWLDSLPPDPPVLVLAEGLSMYLTREEGHELFRRITDHFASGELAFDSHNSTAIRLQRLNPALRSVDATLRWGVDDPYELERAVPRLQLIEAVNSLSAPGAERLPWPSRLAAAALEPFPRLRNLGTYLRYAF